MELKVTTLEGKSAGGVTVSDDIFGLEPRADILQRCVVWQLAKRQAGTHDVKNRAEINRTGKKMYRQKGTGSARHGPAKVNLFRGGGRSFGPTPRSHAIDLPKKVRALALRHALSAKAKDGGIIVLDKVAVAEGKTKALQSHLDKLGLKNALIIDGAEIDAGFRLAARNIPDIDVLPVQGINVYDILRRHTLVLTKAAGLEGSHILAADFADRLAAVDSALLEEARGYAAELSVVPEARLAVELGATAMHDPTEGGIIGAAWEMAEASRCGFRIEGLLREQGSEVSVGGFGGGGFSTLDRLEQNRLAI